MIKLPGVRRLLPSDARPARPRAAGGAGDDYGARAEPDWRTIDWQAHLGQIEVGGARVNYVDLPAAAGAAAGELPVVLVHGLDGCWQNWLETLPRMALGRRAIALDLPGFGASERPPGEISIPGFAACVEELCAQLDTGPVAVVGNSMGGFVSAELAISAPDRVERLVLVSPAGLSTGVVARRPAVGLARVMGAITQSVTAATLSRSAIVRPQLRHLMLGYVFRHPTRLAPDLMYEQVQRAGSPAFMAALDAIFDWDFRDRLPEIRCPTLIIWGRDDMVISVEDADGYEDAIPGARQLVLEDTGHVPQLERPQTFNELLLDFLAERGGLEAAA